MAHERILVVEDESIVALDLETKLEERGYGVVGLATNGPDAISKAVKELPDLVLMDIKLDGEMDGIETAREIRSRVNVPVIYLTAFADERILSRARVTEPLGYLVKPYSEETLHTTIQMALARIPAERAIRLQTEWFSMGLNSIDLGIIMTDTQGQTLFMNKIAKDLFGQEGSGGETFRFLDHLRIEPVKPVPHDENMIQDAVRNNRTVSISRAVILGQEMEYSVSVTVKPIHDEKNLPKGTVCILEILEKHVRIPAAQVSGSPEIPKPPQRPAQIIESDGGLPYDAKSLEDAFEKIDSSTGECEVYLTVFQDALAQGNSRAFEYISVPMLNAVEDFSTQFNHIMSRCIDNPTQKNGISIAQMAMTRLEDDMQETARYIGFYLENNRAEQQTGKTRSAFPWGPLKDQFSSINTGSSHFKALTGKIFREIPIHVNRISPQSDPENPQQLFHHARELSALCTGLNAHPLQCLGILTAAAVVIRQKDIGSRLQLHLQAAYEELKFHLEQLK